MLSHGNFKIYCSCDYSARSYDDKLLISIDTEYRLFRLVERHLCGPDICRLFKSIDEFLKTASSIMNRRKSRAGRAFENHVEYALKDAGIPFDIRPDVDGKPDVLIPGKEKYLDKSFPVDKLFVVGLKTTCKDRWRQVLNEAKRVQHKYLFTLQCGISTNQLTEMVKANVSLVVPQKLHRKYPENSPMQLLDVNTFFTQVKQRLSL